MKKFMGILLASVLCVMMAVAVCAADVYVNDGGTGDGSSAAAPMGSMTDAINKIAATGGTVHIVEVYTCADEYYEPEHKGDIVIDGGRYVFTNGKYNRWFLSGPGSTTFQNITFEYGQGSTSLFLGQFNEMIFGEGITFPSGASDKCYIVGGYQSPTEVADLKTDRDSHVTVKSGNIWAVAGFNRGNGEIEFTGTSHITIAGGTIETVYGANINGNFAGNTKINVTGGTISNLRLGGDSTRRINGNAEATVSGGMVGLLSVNNVLGTATVNYQGGMIASAEKTVSDALVSLVADGTATLNAAPNVEARMLSLTFDAVNYVAAGTTPAVTEATTAATTVAPVVTEATTVATTVAPAVTEAPVETTVAVEETTEAPTETEVAPETTEAVEETEASVETEASETEATEVTAPAPAEEKGNLPVIIGGIVAAVVVVLAVVLVIIKKKKN